MLLCLNKKLSDSSRQFNFREITSFQTVILTVQEVIHSYKHKKSNIHSALIDLTKVLVQIIFNVLMTKQHETQIPFYVLKLLSFKFSKTFSNLSFKGVIGDEWKLGNVAPNTFQFLFQWCDRTYPRVKGGLQAWCWKLQQYYLCSWYGYVSSFYNWNVIFHR